MSRDVEVTDYCSVTLQTRERTTTEKRPLEQYERKGYALGEGDRAKALDAAVALTASRWGPPFDTPYDEAGEWWIHGYEYAATAVENAIVEALTEGEQ